MESGDFGQQSRKQAMIVIALASSQPRLAESFEAPGNGRLADSRHVLSVSSEPVRLRDAQSAYPSKTLRVQIPADSPI